MLTLSGKVTRDSKGKLFIGTVEVEYALESFIDQEVFMSVGDIVEEEDTVTLYSEEGPYITIPRFKK